MTTQEGGKALVYLYRRLLRSCAKYPSKNRWGIYQSIREEFRVRQERRRKKHNIREFIASVLVAQNEKES